MNWRQKLNRDVWKLRRLKDKLKSLLRQKQRLNVKELQRKRRPKDLE